MRSIRKLSGTVALLLAATVAGCGDDPAGPGSLLQDSWVATTWLYTNQANSAQTEELVANGVTVTLTIGPTSYSIVFTQAGQAPVSISGTYTSTTSSFIVTETGSSTAEAIPYALTNGNNTLSMTSSASDWDFDNDGFDEPATLSMVFTRQ